MPEREATPDEIAEFAASARGKGEAERQLVESLHPDPEESEEPETRDATFEAQALLSPKASHLALVRALHGGNEDE